MSPEDTNDAAIDAAIDAADQGDNQSPAAPGAGLPLVSPDVVEQELGAGLDNIVPTRGYRLIPTVCLGGSAGSIPALVEFFQVMPTDAGLVFVVVLHLSPEHASTLPALLAQHTAMRVVQAQDAMAVQVNHVYVIPPGSHLASVDGHLRLFPLEPERGRRVAVDLFFRTLADTHGAHAAAVVLSGADGDGAIGLKRVKERGGLTVAQDPDEAEHDSMPRSAIDTGMVDWVLKTREMPARLLAYFAREERLQLPAEDGADPPQALPPGADPQEASLRETLAFLHTRTGRDFSYYKRATVLRRLSRRLQINAVESLPEYLTFLRTHPGESAALLQDLLISVTNFFRDREAFAALEAHIPQLFRGKKSGEAVRVWVAACASGEEAYSVAMLLAEHAGRLDAPPSIQVFATDLAEDVVQSARVGVYPAAITTDVSEERLARFFTKEPRGYRVRRELRESVLFTQHDLLKDAPFSKLDLVSCRNLLIYLDCDAQSRALDVFHFSLAPHGLLFLGTSESADETSGLFTPLDKKHRLYAARSATKMSLPVPVGVGTLARALQAREQAVERPGLPAATGPATPLAGSFSWPRGERAGDREALSETYLHILARGGPASIIVTAQHDILHLSGGAGRYLQFGEGELTRDLLQAIHPMLRIKLRGALARAAETGQVTQALDLAVELDGKWHGVDIQVTPVQEAASYFVVTFTPRATPPPSAASVASEVNSLSQQLERELTRVKGRLRDVQEQHEITVEEHKSSVEELQAINEELRSASEELETSREELQAINEELTTVNAELKARVDELGHSNSDLHNLMAATNIATVFLDRQLDITRYTPQAVSLFNLIPTDVGRPLTDLKHRLDYPELEQDARQVLANLAPIERTISKDDDDWFLARLQPYRTQDDHIAGVVLTFVDVTERLRAQEALRESEMRFRMVANIAPDLLWSSEPDGTTTWYNDRWLEYTGQSLEEAMEWGWADAIHPEDREGSERRYRTAAEGGQPLQQEHRIRRADGVYRSFLVRTEALRDTRGEVVRWFGSATDIDDLVHARAEVAAAGAAKDHFLAVLSHELRTPLMPITMALALLERRQDVPEAVRRLLETIKRNVDLEKGFIDDLLDVTRVARGKMEIVRAPMDLHEAVRRAVEVSTPDIQAKEQRLTVTLEGEHCPLSGDFARLQQVLWNLLKNASKFTPRGGAIEIRSPCQVGPSYVVEVADTGIGLEAEALARIFQPFEQANVEITREFGGLGLGLAIAKATVEAHGGSLRASSPGLDQGATFTVTLPLTTSGPENVQSSG